MSENRKKQKPEEILHADLEAIYIGNLNTVDDDLTFPQQGKYGSQLSWETGEERFIEANGTVHRPLHGMGNRKVLLTVTAEYEGMTESREVEATVVQEAKKNNVTKIRMVEVKTSVGCQPPLPSVVIVNCAECEPYLTSDYRKMLEEPDKLIGGLKVSLSLFENARGILAVEDNKPDCIERLRELTKDEPKIAVKALKTKYPQGSERHLIYAVTGRAINSSQLPADAGCVVNNVDTVIAIYNAVMEGRPLMHRIVTVTGDAIAEPCNFKVRIGTNYHELVEEAGGFKTPPVKIVSGGPMMGFGIFDLDVPTTKTSSALLCMTKDDVSYMEPSACINCGKCVEACPGRVVPRLLADCAEHYDEEGFLKNNGMECCECGCCSYVCPAKRPLTQVIKSMRKMQLAKKKKK